MQLYASKKNDSDTQNKKKVSNRKEANYLDW